MHGYLVRLYKRTPPAAAGQSLGKIQLGMMLTGKVYASEASLLTGDKREPHQARYTNQDWFQQGQHYNLVTATAGYIQLCRSSLQCIQ